VNQHRQIEQILRSKRRLVEELQVSRILPKSEEEGGCGVVGFCCSEPVPGKHIHEPSKQMHNRGNGKGGGIAAVGFMPEQLGVSREVLDHYYMLHIALLDSSVREEMEKRFIAPHFEVATASRLDTCADWRAMPGLAVKPPDVWRYFVKVKPKVLESFRKQNKLDSVVAEKIEDEFVNQNSFKLNQAYYASLGEQKAFVLSHGKNIMILKVVGYAEAITQYYQIEDLCAYVWIAHQRYPTKGRVWHPGGAHPFAGINMALVHNGDFANYHSVGEYLQQRHIYPQFLTDTEVSALMFDLLNRTYEYPLEYIIEALAPTTELDFDKLPEARRKIYRAIQATHIHGSPDGPWFFIIARNLPGQNQHQLLGITDTAMLRPQVFAFSDGEIQVGLICSEKQAIDATLRSLSEADKRICPVADRYWNARGGSYNDGGAFIFTLSPDSDGKMGMTCTDKFGEGVTLPRGDEPCDFSQGIALSLESEEEIQTILSEKFVPGNDFAIFELICELLPQWTFDEFRAACRQITYQANDAAKTASAIKVLTLLNDRKYPYGNKKFSHIIKIVREELKQIFHNLPGLGPDDRSKKALRRIDFATRPTLREPHKDETTLVIDAEKFAAEGADCDAALLVDAFMLGWRKFIVFNCRGQRYLGCGLGPETDDVTIDAYDSSGDYLGSGLDGLTLTVHGNAQDQLGQIIKRGKLVIHGDVGQTFMYGAKGGEVYVLGNAAGRPLINSVGKPKVVINGTSLDFLAESFMAGDPLNGGGFVILNGIRLNENGKIVPLPEPYPGCNLFSLASGGAIYVRDPHKLMVDQQLNGGEFVPMTSKDWQLILPYLEENERLFGIKVKELLTVDDRLREPVEVYRKVMPSKGGVPESETDDVTAEGEMIEELSIST
jgi:glutamate synthase domain-containing protein 1/glutamate synthase domain-containing protein 3